ncbi:hypothetical protein C3L33_00466, partial [Rhododendron williamsianum]
FLTDLYLGHPTFEISLSSSWRWFQSNERALLYGLATLASLEEAPCSTLAYILGTLRSCSTTDVTIEAFSQVEYICDDSYASRLLANLIVMGGGIMARAVVQAYRQALMNASKNGVAQEAAQNIIRATKIMAEPEARQILGVTERSSWEEILQKYDHLFEKNAKNGSFYLQSKVHRAKECLEMEYRRAAERATGS